MAKHTPGHKGRTTRKKGRTRRQPRMKKRGRKK